MDPRRGVTLLAPAPSLIVEPSVDAGLVGAGISPSGAALVGLSGDRPHPRVLPHVWLEGGRTPNDRRHELAPPQPAVDYFYPLHADHFPSSSLDVEHLGSNIMGPREEVVGAPALIPE